MNLIEGEVIDKPLLKELQIMKEKAKAFDELHEAGFVRIKYEKLKKWQEDVEMLKSVKKDRDVAVEEWKKCEKIIERLKKLCEGYTGKEKDSSYGIFYDMIQKILEEEKNG